MFSSLSKTMSRHEGLLLFYSPGAQKGQVLRLFLCWRLCRCGCFLRMQRWIGRRSCSIFLCLRLWQDKRPTGWLPLIAAVPRREAFQSFPSPAVL